MLKNLIFLFFVTYNLLAQPNEINNRKDSVEYYHFFINQAELSICDSNYIEANDFYKKAFMFSLPFPEDLYNASLSAIYSDKYKLAINYCKKLVALGVEKRFFNQIPYNLLKQNTDLWNKFISDYNGIRKNFEESVNWKLRREIESLVEKDQHNYCNIDKSLRTPEDSIFNILTDIIKNYGYPTAYLTGIETYNDTLITDHVDLLLRHYYQENNYILSPVLLKELYKGKISPVRFVTNEDFKYQPESFYGTAKLHKDNKGNYYFLDEFKNYEKIKKYNFNRQKVMMFSYQDEVKKFINKDKSKFRLKITGFFRNSNVDKRYDYRKFIRGKNLDVNIKYPSKSKMDSITGYFTFINKAELFLCENKIDQASGYYSKAFQYSGYPFPNDLYNAALCLIELGKYDKAVDLCMKLVETGIDLEFFNKTVFKKLRNNPWIWKNFLTRYDISREIYKNKIDFKLRNQIKKLNKDFFKIEYNFEMDNKKKQKIKDSIYVEMKDILLKYGYPYYATTGIEMNKDTFITDNSLISIIRAYYNDGNFDLSGFLKDQVYFGKIKPNNYFKLEDIKYSPIEYYGSNIRIVKGEYYELDTTLWKGKVLLFDKHRKILFPFAETYRETMKKNIYHLKNNDIFKYSNGTVRLKKENRVIDNTMKYIIPVWGLEIDNSMDTEYKFIKINLDDY